ncbi:NACHT domain-containing protein [Streptomyces sp. Q6]|uniref:NACHT domain-containing protein n=1 Tax=Streptomyces citrinus TaxID=3118173 RepID=A0ACD5AA56_9ACTN
MTTHDADGPDVVARRGFTHRLRDLRDAAGAKNADLVAASGRMAGKAPGGRALTANTVSRLLSGKGVKAPDWDVVASFVAACRAHAAATKSPASPALFDLTVWKAEHTALVRFLEAGGVSDATAHDIEAALTAYAERARETWGHLDLEVLLPLDDQGRHPDIRLREVFVEPGVRADPPPVELPRELVRRLVESGELPESDHLPSGTLDALKELRGAYEQRPTRPVLQVLGEKDTRKHVLLGDPGAGKSTLAKYLALTLAGSGSRADVPPALADRVGVIVELRQYAEPQWHQRTYEDFLAHRQDQLGLCVPPSVLRHLLHTGRAVVVFDGLDEVFDPKVRQAASEQIAAFAARWPQARIVVTSRVIGYKRHVFDGADFTHYMLQDLDTEQIATFTERWYTLSAPTDTEKAALLAQRLQDAVRDSRPIRELAGNPLLLTILAIVGRRQPLPKDRIGVYRQAVTVLTAQWDQQAKHLEADLPPAIKDVLDGLDRQEVLMMLAHAMQAGTHGIAGNHIHGDDLEELLRTQLEQYGLPLGPARTGARALVSQLRERNFILARYGSEVYGFVHRAFLEHLAADIYQRYTRGRAWTPQELLDQVIAPHAHDPAWHEVLLLLIGQLQPSDAAAAIDRLLDLHDGRGDLGTTALLEVAIRALAEVPKIGLLNSQSERAVKALTDVLNTPWVPVELTPVFSALASFGPYWVGREAFLAWFRTRGQFSPSTDTPRIVCLLRPSREELIRFTRDAYSPFDRVLFLEALAEGWPSDSEVYGLLRDLAREGEDEEVRRTALGGLARNWRGDTGALAVFSAVAREQVSARVRWVALWALAEARPAGDGVRFLLREILRRSNVRFADDVDHEAVVERWAAALGPHMPRIGPRVRGETRADMPGEILRLLARHRPGDVDVRTLLIAWASLDDDYTVPQVAMRGLMDHWGQDPEIHDLFAGWVQGDALWPVRESATRLLARLRPDHGPTRQLLRTLATGDNDATLHYVAREVLEDLWRKDATDRNELFEVARTDADRNLRGTAVRALADRWPADPEVRALAFDLARAGEHVDTLGLVAERWPQGEDVYRLLIDSAATEGDLDVREAALRALVRHWPGSTEVRALLMDMPRVETDPATRALALRLLVEHWPGDAEVRAVAEERVRELHSEELFSYVDRDFLCSLRYWRRHEDSLPLFLALVRQGALDLRGTALQMLADRWWGDPGVRALVLDAVRGETDETVLESAVHAVAEHCSDDPEVLELIAALAHGSAGLPPMESAQRVLALATAGPDCGPPPPRTP